jgi:hypothetical protein
MADYSARCETLQTNERIKHFVSVLTAWGNALAIAAFARVGLSAGLDLNSASWLTGATMLLWPSSLLLGTLEAENNDD